MTGDPADISPPLLRMIGIGKSFPGVRALRSASIDVRAGEIHALVGENGAGKSTLIRVLTGAHLPDQGSIELEGRPIRIGDPIAAFRAGVAAIYQEFNLVPALSVRENLFLGREPGGRRILDPAEEQRLAREVLARLRADLNPEETVRDLSLARRQLVEIARTLLADARLLIMDEPTAALTPRETETLFQILRDLRARGHGILFVSHRLGEVERIADRVTVLRDGATLGTWPISELPRERMIALMVGRSLEQGFPPSRSRPGEEVFAVRDLTGGRVKGVSFSLSRGEVVGLAGLVGAGRTDLARLIFGADRRDRGEILLDGQALRIRSPKDAIESGICLLTEDRKGQGLILGLSAKENFALPNLRRLSRRGWIRSDQEAGDFLQYVESLKIRLASPDQKAGELSGGNQQKLLIARWLESDSRVILFDEPTRGIDVGAKYEICLLIRELAAKGKAILMISSELPEILGMSDRILVMREGRIASEIRDVATATQEGVMSLAVAG